MTPNEKDFVALIKKHEGIIYKISRIYAKDADDRNDLYQDIVFQIWKYYGSFKGASKISTWIYRVALNTSITRWRKEKRHGEKVNIDHLFLKQAEDYSPEFEERLHWMYQQIKTLNAIEKGLIVLLLEGKKYNEIAEITGLSSTNVGTKISRIKQKLKAKASQNKDL